ncbi:MAG TPA: TMEM175 family protein [Gemmatimonadaceae bacterium]|nr:TMEM175 family protein [Gemmatimonadaceae bacterium]
MNQHPSGFVLGRSRFEALSDGVFAIAITVLVPNVHP